VSVTLGFPKSLICSTLAPTYYYLLDAETSNVSSVFIARGYLRSNAKNRHPFNHLPRIRWWV